MELALIEAVAWLMDSEDSLGVNRGQVCVKVKMVFIGKTNKLKLA